MKIPIIVYTGLIICTFSCENITQEKSEMNQIETSDVPIETASENIEQENESKNEIELVSIDFENTTKGIIEKDSTIWLMANIRKDHRMFGYEEASVESRKLFLLSVFTDEVEGNPFNCQYGSYYQTHGMDEAGILLKYISDTLDFRKLAIIKKGSIENYSYVEDKWLEFEKDE